VRVFRRLSSRLLLVAVLLLGPVACRGSSASPSSGPTSAGNAVTSPTTAGSAGSADSPPSTTAATAAGTPALLRIEVLDRRPHDTSAFTEGLVVADGRLFESTGLLGSSSLREVDLVTGKVIRLRQLPKDVFAEGLAAVGNQLVQLTWKNGVALVWDRDTFNEVRRFSYQGEGWGLCYDPTAKRLVQSDGSSQLTFRNPDDFSVMGKVSVILQGRALDKLNELECAPDGVWANVWL
jgi:glutaminyl-peptide cyclotransferase